jgi:hypothetical protein
MPKEKRNSAGGLIPPMPGGYKPQYPPDLVTGFTDPSDDPLCRFLPYKHGHPFLTVYKGPWVEWAKAHGITDDEANTQRA